MKIALTPRQKFYLFLTFIGLVLASLLIFDLRSFVRELSEENMTSVVVVLSIFVITSIAPVPSTPLIISAAALYGPYHGAFYSTVGESIGALLSFGMARLLGEDQVRRALKSHHEKLYAYDLALREKGIMTTIFLRIIPILPLTVVNYGLGLTEISWRDYGIGTIVGLAIVSIIYGYIGVTLTALSWPRVLISIGLASVLAAALVYTKKQIVSSHGARE